MADCCVDCHYWVRVEKSRLGGVVGECRFSPPAVFPGPEFQADRLTLWPRTQSHDWCGKFEARRRSK